MSRDVILTGLRTNADYHLGNYIGGMLPMVEAAQQRAQDHLIKLFVPDLHSFTTPIDHSNFYAQTSANLRLLVAAGMPLDNPNVLLYRQSFLPSHSQAAWILSNFASYGDLSRMVEFKDKKDRLKPDQITVGLFTYPILMAADILMHDARWVPVGDDQRQHLEFCRRLATRINQRFGPLFIVPETMEAQQAFVDRAQPPRILSLKNPDNKMSKSIDDPAGTIGLLDDPKLAANKIKAATTDSKAQINYDWQNQPAITNLLTILAATSGQTQSQVNQAWQAKSDYASLKQTVAESVASFLSQLQTKLKAVDDQQLAAHLQASEKQLNQQLNHKLYQLQQAIGLRQA